MGFPVSVNSAMPAGAMYIMNGGTSEYVGHVRNLVIGPAQPRGDRTSVINVQNIPRDHPDDPLFNAVDDFIQREIGRNMARDRARLESTSFSAPPRATVPTFDACEYCGGSNFGEPHIQRGTLIGGRPVYRALCFGCGRPSFRDATA